jgi:hypothetical protein
MQKFTTKGLSLPNEWIKRIDFERGDISRSRFLLRLVEKAYKMQAQQNNIGGTV